MERVNQVLFHKTYQTCIKEIETCEENRIYCRHNMEHFLDVARIAYIINLEEKLQISKETIYVTALLHDVGRHIQYQNGTPHEQASVPIAKDILEDCGFEETEIEEILQAIKNHRNKNIKDNKNLSGIIYRADKLSRCCFACKATDTCHKSVEKRRKTI